MRTIDYIHNILENWKQALLAFLPNLVLAIVVLIAFLAMARMVKRINTGINNTAVEFEIYCWIRFNTEDDFKEAASDIIIQLKEQLEDKKCTVNQIALIR